jgi:hypothetical protein
MSQSFNHAAVEDALLEKSLSEELQFKGDAA